MKPIEGIEPYDKEFAFALRHLLALKGLSQAELCDLSRDDAGNRRLSPAAVAGWLNLRTHPSSQAVILVCQLLEIPRSLLYSIGEELGAMEVEVTRQRPRGRRPRTQTRDVDAIRMAIENLGPDSFDDLDDLEAVLRDRRQEMERHPLLGKAKNAG